MGSVSCHISVSLDGFVAGPDQSVKNPLGEGGERLHGWVFVTDRWLRQQGKSGGEHSADAEVVDEVVQGVGAYIMGRKMFGGGEGPWDQTWKGWWGENPPYHTPVFVLITTRASRSRCRAERGSPSSPMGSSPRSPMLGAGERLLVNVGDPTLEPIKVFPRRRSRTSSPASCTK